MTLPYGKPVLVCTSVCVTDLSRGFDAPDETEKDNNPGQSKAAEDWKTYLSKVTNVIRDFQHIMSGTDRDT